MWDNVFLCGGNLKYFLFLVRKYRIWLPTGARYGENYTVSIMKHFFVVHNILEGASPLSAAD